MQHVCTFVIPGQLVNYFSGNGCDVSIHAMGEPFYSYQLHYIEKNGHTWEHINFLVEDVEAAYDRLVAKGAIPRCEPCMMAHVSYASVGDPEYNVLYELMRFRDDDDLALGQVSVEQAYRSDELRLGQISLIVPDLRKAENRLADFFGLHTVYEHTRHDSGFILMADPFWDVESHNFLVKVWGGPNIGLREKTLLEEKGPHFDCIVYYANDVAAAYEKAVDNGAQGVAGPRAEAACGGIRAWIRDAEGNDVCIMEPPPVEAITAALGTGGTQEEQE